MPIADWGMGWGDWGENKEKPWSPVGLRREARAPAWCGGNCFVDFAVNDPAPLLHLRTGRGREDTQIPPAIGWSASGGKHPNTQ